MGMIPAEEAPRIQVEIPVRQTPEIRTVSWFDDLLLSLRQFFA